MRVRLVRAFAIVAVLTLALPALWAQRSNGSAYDQSRTPTPNQLLAACSDEWSILSKNGNADDSAWSFIYKITQASSAELLSSSYVENQSSAYCASFGRCDGAVRQSVQCFVNQTLAGRAGRFRTPSMTVKAIVDDGTLGRQDPQGYSASPSRSVAAIRRAPVATKPAPVAVTNLPKGRPERTAPWSPRAMSIDPDKPLDPKYAAERADALASCPGPMQEYVYRYSGGTPLTRVEANMLMEATWLNDKDLAESADDQKTTIARIDSKIADTNPDAVLLATWRVFRCLSLRRVAQLEGSPLIPGAVDGSLNPLSIGGAAPAWKQQGKDAHIIASNGKSAMHCVSLETIASGDSSLSGAVARRVLVNHCDDEVGFIWCNSPGDCETERGNAWNMLPGRSWPIAGDGQVRWAACHGRDTASTVRGSYGLRYYCNAPLVESKRSAKR